MFPSSECGWDLPGLASNQEDMPKVKGIREYVDGIMSHEMVAPTLLDSFIPPVMAWRKPVARLRNPMWQRLQVTPSC